MGSIENKNCLHYKGSIAGFSTKEEVQSEDGVYSLSEDNELLNAELGKMEGKDDLYKRYMSDPKSLGIAKYLVEQDKGGFNNR